MWTPCGKWNSHRLGLIAVLTLFSACSDVPEARPVDTALVDLSLRSIAPDVLLPNTRLVLEGDAFVDDPWGSSRLRLQGDSNGNAIDIELAAEFVDFQRLDVLIGEADFEEFGTVPALFDGWATVLVDSAVDGKTYRSRPIEVDFEVSRYLDPDLKLLSTDGVIFPNEPLQLAGTGLLLGDEGTTRATIRGCFRLREESSCTSLKPTVVEVSPNAETLRDEGTLTFSPAIAGILPGTFEGEISFSNEHTDGVTHTAPPQSVSFEQVEPILFSLGTSSASLGQYVDVDGAGFLGPYEGQTILDFGGTFEASSGGLVVPVNALLIPEILDGHRARYVMNEEDELAKQLDLRRVPGRIRGLIKPRISYKKQNVEGSASSISFDLLGVKQVIWLDFLPSYTESLRHFGLRAVDHRIRDQVIEVLTRDFATINVEFRTEQPQDFALFSQVEIGGPDPNGLGLLGYDNTHGKDTENQRLHDRIGGVNAVTQGENLPGYGGVFVDSLFGFSEHPGEFAESVLPDPRFDLLFDPFRSDRGGHPILAADLTSELPIPSANECPTNSESRQNQIACAIYALGNLIGGTVSHEIAHSLGLADPYGALIHNAGNQPNRIMDGNRPFGERAIVGTEGPARFCTDAYFYLRNILPTPEPTDPTPRSSCW